MVRFGKRLRIEQPRETDGGRPGAKEQAHQRWGHRRGLRRYRDGSNLCPEAQKGAKVWARARAHVCACVYVCECA